MALSQSHYRFGLVEGAESTHGWLAGEDRDPPLRIPGAAGQFLLRFCVQETAGAAASNVALEYQYRHTPQATGVPGAWTNVTTSSSVVRTGATAVFANGANCTKRLSGTGTFEASGAGCTHDGSAGGNANDIAANGCSETLCGMQVLGGDTAVGDLVEFRLTRGGQPLDAYAVTPSLRVGLEILAVQERAAGLHTSLSAGMSKLRNTEVRVECSGLAPADLADADLSITMHVLGTTVVGSTDPADYTVPLYGPDVWSGGNTGKDGLPIRPGFSWQADVERGVRRVLATFEPSRTCTFGASATVVE